MSTDIIQDIIQVQNIYKSFPKTEGQELLVLDNINFNLRDGEIIALLGKSGSGKSTLLNIIAGLIKPSEGQIIYDNQPIKGPAQGISMVFQSFALLPWLTVLENVELGLEAQGIERKVRREKALKAIDVIGMDGFESAYPKELSGGMRQRVGFARALVVDPKILLMDEPFSALDILTSENLRNDLLELWNSKRTNIKGILFVTHDIEEAVLIANRIIVFASDPGQIQEILEVPLAFPRDPESLPFKSLLDKIYTLMTVKEREKLVKAQLEGKIKAKTFAKKHPEYAYRLPNVSVSELTGLLEAMKSHEENGKVDLPVLAEELHLDVDNLFPLTEALDVLKFSKIENGDLIFLEAGRLFAEAKMLDQKHLFAKQLLENIPLARHIKEVLDLATNHRVSENYFLEELQEFIIEEEATQLLKIIIDWGRYAEILAFDYNSGMLSLENPK